MSSLLQTIQSPHDVRRLGRTQLPQLAQEVRQCVLDNVSRTGGHLSSNLGTVELTVALHYVFNTPDDRIVWNHRVFDPAWYRQIQTREIMAIPAFRKIHKSAILINTSQLLAILGSLGMV